MKYCILIGLIINIISCSKKENTCSKINEIDRKVMNFNSLEINFTAEPGDLSIKLTAKVNEHILQLLKNKEFELIKDFKYRDKTGHFLYVEAKNNKSEVYFKIADYYIRANGPDLENSYFFPISPKQVTELKALLKKP